MIRIRIRARLSTTGVAAGFMKKFLLLLIRVMAIVCYDQG